MIVFALHYPTHQFRNNNIVLRFSGNIDSFYPRHLFDLIIWQGILGFQPP